MDSAQDTAPLLVRGRWVVTGGGPDDAVVQDGAVVVADGQVQEVGAWSTLRTRYPAADVLGADDVAILPGIVNAHHHSQGASRVQHGVADDLLELWLLDVRRARVGDPYLDTLLTTARLLRSGVTSVVEVHGCRGPAEAAEARVRRSLAAYDEAGLRVAFAPGVADQNGLVSGADAAEVDRFLAALPPDARAAAGTELPRPGDLTPDEYLALMDALCREYADHPRVDVWFGPPGPNWVSDGFLQRIAERAAAHGTGIQTHVSESVYEKLYGPRTYGRPVLLHLRELGMLGPRFSLAHAVWLTEAEIRAAAETGTSVSHNPSSNLRLRAGIAPLTAMLDAGVTVGLGLDGTTLDDDDDAFREMRLALRLQRAPTLAASVPTPAQMLHTATAGGAKLLGKEDSLGRLAPGYAADLVLVDLARICWPWVAPEVDPRDLLVSRAQARDVRTVLVGGEVMLRDGHPTRFDLEAAWRELAARLAATPFPSDANRRVDLLREHVAAFYAGWDEPDFDPYVRYNSRR